MKIKFLFVFIFFSVVSNAQITFQKTYGTNYQDWATKIIQPNKNEYLITGYTDGFGASGNIFLLDLDSLGNIKFLKNFFGVNADVAYDVFVNRLNGFSIIGYTSSYGTGCSDGILISMDSSTNIQWSKTYGTSAICDYIECGAKTSDGFVLGGSDGQTTAKILRTDITGNIIWYETIPGANNVQSIVSILQTKDGGFAALNSTTFNYMSIIKFSTSGNILWVKQTQGLVVKDFKETKDKGFIITGSGGSGGDILLLKTDSIGNYKWSKLFGGTFYEIGESVTQTNDGGYIIGGYTNSFGFGGDDAVLIKTDSLGNLQWANTYGDVWDDDGLSVIQTLDGGYALLGVTDMNGSNSDSVEVLLIKTDASGNTNCQSNKWTITPTNGAYGLSSTTYSIFPYGTSTNPTVTTTFKNFTNRDFCLPIGVDEMKESEINISISPNPSMGLFTIKSEKEFSSIEILNVLGEKVYSSSNNARLTSSEIDLRKQPKGIYFYKVLFSKGETTSGKIIIE